MKTIMDTRQSALDPAEPSFPSLRAGEAVDVAQGVHCLSDEPGPPTIASTAPSVSPVVTESAAREDQIAKLVRDREFARIRARRRVVDGDRITPLDGLRGVAALMVIVFHLWQDGYLSDMPIPAKLTNLFVFGQTGVDLFFVLSGFLITRILLATRDNPRFFTNFYARRSLRIFPLYYFSLVLVYFAFPVIQQQPMQPLEQQWWYWLYLQNVPATFPSFSAKGPGHFWSLAVEEHFYLLWPAMLYFTPRAALARLSVVLILVAIGFRAVLLYAGFGVFYFTPCRMDALAMGTILATLEPQLAAKPRVLIRVVLSAAAVFFGLVVAWPCVSGLGGSVVQLLKFSAIAFVYFGVIAYVAFGKMAIVNKVLGSGVMAFVGTISYGLYVYHPFCISFIKSRFRGEVSIPHAAIALIVTFFAATLSYYLLEKPFLNLKRLFKSRESAQMLAICQTANVSNPPQVTGPNLKTPLFFDEDGC